MFLVAKTVPPEPRIKRASLRSLSESLSTEAYAYTSGTTHSFYHYPARFSPSVARDVIQSFTRPGDWILDPFMGGGTAIIESLLQGRRALGVDINALAHFIADVRTRPLSIADEEEIRSWALKSRATLPTLDPNCVDRPGIRNLPPAVEVFMAGALELASSMCPRRLAFARCALLRLGQWALDCRKWVAPRRKKLGDRLEETVEQMLAGLREFETRCQGSGMSKLDIKAGRVLLNRSAVGIDVDTTLATYRRRPRLVFTSPPYPGVNVLYHRWQYRGRRETPAPYWIADVPDGCGYSYYTGGSRTPTGLRNYFSMITDAFTSIARFAHPNAHFVQLIGFSDAQTQLPEYIRRMRAAGLREVHREYRLSRRLQRQVPNRKWYAEMRGQVDTSTEYLLIHRRA